MIHYMSAIGIASPWVGNELRYVSMAGIPVKLHSLRKPAGHHHESEWAAQMAEATEAVYPLEPVKFAKHQLLAPLKFRGRYARALANALLGERESVRARVAALAHFFVACDWAQSVDSDNMDLIHSQWIHSSGTVAYYGARLLNVPFSFTGHAVDLFRERVALKDKIRLADFIVCISEFHRQFYLKNGADPNKLFTVYCGIDLTLFKPVAKPTSPRPFTIVSAGRLIDKKGFHVLIEACKQLLAAGRDFRCVIGGSGPLESELREQVARAGLGERVKLTGEQLMQERIPEFMEQGDLFCLPCVWAKDDDVDGLPQLLMEAMACGLPGVSTRLVGIPDLIIDRETGLLVEPEDASSLADTLAWAMDHPEELPALVEGAEKHLKRRFDITTCLEPLIERFKTYLK